MRKCVFLISFMLCICIVCSAFSERWTWFSFYYNSSASYFGAKQLEGEDVEYLSVKKEKDTYYFDYKTYDMAFTFDSNDHVISIVARLFDESLSTDYLLSCLTIVTTFGGIDLDAYGQLLLQFALTAKGEKPSLPCYIGTDAFVMQPGEKEIKYTFTYLNNDLKYGDE